VPTQLKRYYGANHLHFITFCCYHHRPLLGTLELRDLFLSILEETRQRYQFVIVGYVVMPDHVHLLISEPEKGDPSVIVKVVKHRFARQVRQYVGAPNMPGVADPVWQKRFHDFNVWSEDKRIEKLRYIHRNPVKAGLVSEPDQWAWSSFRSYAYGEQVPVRINFQEWPLQIKKRKRESFA
jgi:REP-associated tyrosine transposase